MLRRGWRQGAVEEGIEMGNSLGGDGVGELLRRGWRCGAV